ncbi:MAG: hypothetical protein ABR576_05035 [Thermoanaerobaculia bacterium]
MQNHGPSRCSPRAAFRSLAFAVLLSLAPPAILSAPTPNGALPGPFPLFPPTNWWNLDVSSAPVDPQSAAYIAFIHNGATRRLHPDFGGQVSPGSVAIYGMPYVVVDGTQPKKAVQFHYWRESDGVNQATGQSYPFYPIPDEAITQAHWIERGQPGNQDLRSSSDRHLILVDRDNRYLYELFNVFYDGATWRAGSGAFFDMNANGRRPEGWTSADAAGLAILPGLVRYEEAYGSAEIGHAFRVTVRATNGYVFPASHAAGSTPAALPMGARLRLRADKDISGFPPALQKIFRAMKRHGLMVADNGADMYVTGTFDTRWNNDVLNPAFRALNAGDFEVIQLGWRGDPPATPLSFHTLTPCRLVDTRGAVGARGGPALAAGATRSFRLAGICGIPVGARAVSLNVTVTQPSQAGSLRLYPGAGAPPGASTINYRAGQTRANNGVSGLGASGEISVRSDQAAGTAHLVLDVNGYFQ